MKLFLGRFSSNCHQNVQNIPQLIYNKAFWEISIYIINELFIFEPDPPTPPALEFSKYMQKIYKNCLDYPLNLAIVRIPLEKNLDPPIIEISLAMSNLYAIAVKS